MYVMMACTHLGRYHGYEDDMVALFTTKEKGEAYVKKALLAGKSEDDLNPYRPDSLLAHYNSVWIEKCPWAGLEIDPEI